MTNHVHLIYRCSGKYKPGAVLGDFKKHTSKEIVQAIIDNPRENRREMLLKGFKDAASKSSNVKEYQFWRHDNKPIELWSNSVIKEKLNYVHSKPVEAGLVFRAEDYVYSSAVDYADGKGLIPDIIFAR